MSDIIRTDANQVPVIPITERPAYVEKVDKGNVEDLMVGGGAGVPRISLKNNVFTLIDNGNIVATFPQKLAMVIIGAQKKVGRVYYANRYDAADEHLHVPACWSTDGERADVDVVKCPSPDGTCRNCPMNIKGSAENGGRACQFMKNLAVRIVGDPVQGRVFRLVCKGGTLFGPGRPQENLFNLGQYAKYLASIDSPLTTVLTEAVFDTQATTPNKLLFRCAGFLEEKLYRQEVEPIPEENIERAIKVDFGELVKVAQQRQEAEQAPAQPQAQAQPQQPQAQPQQMQAQAQQAQAFTAPSEPPATNPPVDTAAPRQEAGEQLSEIAAALKEMSTDF